MIIYKNKENATNLIFNFVNKLNLVHLLNEVERKFLGLDYNINALSLTDGQSINHQLRFYHMNFGIELINSIVLKVINNINNKNLEINTYFLKEPEHFFINRLLELKDKTTKIEFFYDNTVKLEELNYSVKEMNYYLNKGDNWSGIEIAEKLLTHKNSEYDTLEIYHKLALAYHSVNNSLASENLLKKIIEKECDNDEFINLKKISALYILSMLYLRHHPASFLNIDKATNYLNTAYDLLNDPNLKHPDRDFTSIFNRNGYALVLFKKGKVEECIALLDTKINELSSLIQKGKDYLLLHKTVLMYNLYQCYEKNGQLDKAESTLREIISVDKNDVEYKYDLIRLLMNEGKIEEANEILDEIFISNQANLSFYNSYKGYYFLEKDNIAMAEYHFGKAFIQNCLDQYNNEFLYNYLYCLFARGENSKIKELSNCKLYGDNYVDEIKEILDGTINEKNKELLDATIN